MKTTFELIYDVVRKIPRGCVATYGQIATLAGNPRWSRVVGYALHVNPEPGVIPCHRVVNRLGETSSAFAFGGEESSGMSFLRKDGRVWTTDKDGLIPDLLAAEITAKTGKNPAQLHQEQVERFGESWYKRVDTPTTLEQKQKFAKLTGDDVEATQLAGEDITAKLTEAPGNHAKIGGLKVTTKDNWFAARPSGTENIYKVYAESFESPEALDKVLAEATEVVDKALAE